MRQAWWRNGARAACQFEAAACTGAARLQQQLSAIRPGQPYKLKKRGTRLQVLRQQVVRGAAQPDGKAPAPQRRGGAARADGLPRRDTRQVCELLQRAKRDSNIFTGQGHGAMLGGGGMFCGGGGLPKPAAGIRWRRPARRMAGAAASGQQPAGPHLHPAGRAARCHIQETLAVLCHQRLLEEPHRGGQMGAQGCRCAWRRSCMQRCGSTPHRCMHAQLTQHTPACLQSAAIGAPTNRTCASACAPMPTRFR